MIPISIYSSLNLRTCCQELNTDKLLLIRP
jgi:hypothetical protein